MRLLSFVLATLLSVSLAQAEGKKVLILYAGAGGHATAAKSVEKMINEKLPTYTVVRRDFADDTSGPAKFFITKAYDMISRHASFLNVLLLKFLWLQEAYLPRHVAKRQFIQLISPEKTLRTIEAEKPDIIISTYFAAAEVLAVLRYKGHLRNIPIAWTQLDLVDEIYYEQIGDELDMSFLPTKTMAASWKPVIGADKVAASGIPVLPSMVKDIDKSERTRVAGEWNMDPALPTIVLMGGSAGALSYRTVIDNFLAENKAEGPVQFVAICGQNEKARTDLQKWAASSSFPADRVRVVATGFIPLEKVRDLQAAADLIISKPGGLSSFELLASGSPVILTESIGVQETQNANYLENEGAALFVPKAGQAGRMAAQLIAEKAMHARMVESQNQLRAEIFDLDLITDWVANARVVQPLPPAEPVLRRIRRAQREAWAGPSTAVGNCESVFAPEG